MKLFIPVLLALTLVLVAFTFAHAEAVSAAPGTSTTPVTAPAILTSTITSTGVLTKVNLTGVIVSGAGENLPANISVTLYAYQPNSTTMDLIFSNTTTAQSGGKYTFENVAKPNGAVYLTSAMYAGLPYHSSPSMGEPMTITVFDVTTSTDHLMADQLHLIFNFPSAGDLEVLEVYILSNVGTRTIVAEKAGQLMVDFPLPQGASNPDFRSGVVGEADLVTNDGYWETPAVRPGGLFGVSYAFSMPYAGKATLNQPVPLTVNAVGALLPATGNLKIESSGLVDNGLSDFGGTSYHIYSGNSLQAGTQLAVNISGDPNAAASSAGRVPTGSRLGLIIGLGAFGLALVLAGVWISRRNRISPSETEAEVVEAEEPEPAPKPAPDQPDGVADAETLMDDIIALDDLYQAGELPEAAYRDRRAELKEKLRLMLGDKE